VATRWEWFAFVAAAFVTPIVLALAGWSWVLLVTLAAVPLVVPLWATVRGFTERRQLNLVLKGTARLSLVVAVLFAIGLALGPRA
jgi:1,4-dihydroxy-2-naphthoate octaprenyltransferase